MLVMIRWHWVLKMVGLSLHEGSGKVGCRTGFTMTLVCNNSIDNIRQL